MGEADSSANGKHCGCGAPLVGTQRTSCDPCKRERRIAYYREWRGANPDYEKTRPRRKSLRTTCLACGEPLQEKEETYCTPCRRERNRVTKARARERNPNCRSCGKPLDGPDPYRCKACRREYMRAYRAANPDAEAKRNYHRKKKYGLDATAFDAMWEAQEGRCLICTAEMTQPTNRRGQDKRCVCVDHCHGTGEVRGLLCNRCNSGMGMFGDDPDLLAEAVAYLRASTP